MLWHVRSIDALRFNLYSSSTNNSAIDIEQVIEYIRKFKLQKTQTKITKDEMLSYLYLAYPAGFEQICFLWDIPTSSPHDEVIEKIKEMASLVVSLSRQNLIVKVFAPLELKGDVAKHLGGIRSVGDLVWNNNQLRQLLNRKTKDKFESLWDNSMREAIGEMLVLEANSSPRLLVRLLLHLMDYAEVLLIKEKEPLQEGETLKKNDFDQAFSGFAGKK